MKARVFRFLSFLSILLQVQNFSVSAQSQSVPATISGTWLSSQVITVRFEDEKGEYSFVSDTVHIRIIIDAVGNVNGTCGDAAFSGCQLRENRSWFGGLFNLGTDYVFEGNLKGKIFDMDPLPEKTIKAPFNLRDGYLMGSLFQKEGWDKHQMVSFKLGKR